MSERRNHTTREDEYKKLNEVILFDDNKPFTSIENQRIAPEVIIIKET